jgi:hypothetical protein
MGKPSWFRGVTGCSKPAHTGEDGDGLLLRLTPLEINNRHIQCLKSFNRYWYQYLTPSLFLITNYMIMRTYGDGKELVHLSYKEMLEGEKDEEGEYTIPPIGIGRSTLIAGLKSIEEDFDLLEVYANYLDDTNGKLANLYRPVYRTLIANPYLPMTQDEYNARFFPDE